MAKENKPRETKPIINTNTTYTTLGAEVPKPKDKGRNK